MHKLLAKCKVFSVTRPLSTPQIIDALGGARLISEHLHCNIGTVYRWKYALAPRTRTRGTGGRIPRARHDRLLALAVTLGVNGTITRDVLEQATL